MKPPRLQKKNGMLLHKKNIPIVIHFLLGRNSFKSTFIFIFRINATKTTYFLTNELFLEFDLSTYMCPSSLSLEENCFQFWFKIYLVKLWNFSCEHCKVLLVSTKLLVDWGGQKNNLTFWCKCVINKTENSFSPIGFAINNQSYTFSTMWQYK